MEAISNMAVSAAKAVWGESPTTAEPVSGRTGDTSKGEPYDAGNMDPPSAIAGDEPNDDYDNENSNYALSSGREAGGKTSGISVDGGADNADNAEADTTKTDSRDAGDAAGFAKSTGVAAESEDTPQNPSTDLKAKVGLDEDTTKAQNDTRSPDDPKTNPKSAPTDVNDAPTSEDGALNEAQQLDGPGPKPVQELAKENGGDAGHASSSSSVDNTPSPNELEDKNKKDAEERNDGEEGTGEKYVKSNGLKADGGDFDATQPGAGREADRLMETKGMRNPADPDSSKGTASSTDNADSGKEKKSLGKKIKEKLHRH